MIIVTTDTVSGKEIKEIKGFVRGSTVQTKHIGKDILAGLKTIVGGEIGEYTEMMDEARKRQLAEWSKMLRQKGPTQSLECGCRPQPLCKMLQKL